MPGGQENGKKKDGRKEQAPKNLKGDGTAKDRPKAPGCKTPGYVPTGNPRGRPKKTE